MDFNYKWFIFLEIFICVPLAVKGLSAEDLQNCPQTQYGTIGNSAIVQCDVKESSDQFYWFDESSDDDPILRYENGTISGSGYDSKEYNLTRDGSLVINEVDFTGNRVYTISALDENFELVEMTNITFIITEEASSTKGSVAMITDATTTVMMDSDGGFPIWAIILIIVAAIVILFLIVAVIIKNVRKKDKAQRTKMAGDA